MKRAQQDEFVYLVSGHPTLHTSAGVPYPDGEQG
jgi:hypothetical protein